MQRPQCPLCEVELEHTPQGWRCPTCTFFYQVTRGVAGRPMWGAQEVESVQQQQVTTEETFEEWLAKRGVTKDMWNFADERTKEDLKAAFCQRNQKDADVVLLPPR